MEVPQYQYQLRFQQTGELIRKFSSEKRIKKYLEALQNYNPHVLDHSFRVALLCVDLGFENEFGEREIQLLGYAGLLHDIGKVQISLEVLDKDSILTSFEKELVNEHTRSGSQVVHGFGDDLRRIIIGHHEYQENSYPRKKTERRASGRKEKGRREDNPLIESLTEILAVSDSYDALRSERVYKPSKDKAETKRIMLSQYTGDSKYINQLLKR